MIIVKFSLFFLRSFVHLRKIRNTALMETRDLNRIKVMLAEKKRTNKWLAEQLGKDPATISKWVTNASQPSLGNIVEISKLLDVDVQELIRVQ